MGGLCLSLDLLLREWWAAWAAKAVPATGGLQLPTPLPLLQPQGSVQRRAHPPRVLRECLLDIKSEPHQTKAVTVWVGGGGVSGARVWEGPGLLAL